MTNRFRRQLHDVKNVSYSQLEKRHLLSADLSVELFDTAQVSSPTPEIEYVDVQWKGESLLAKNDQWIIWQEDKEGIQSQDYKSLKVGDGNELTVNGT